MWVRARHAKYFVVGIEFGYIKKGKHTENIPVSFVNSWFDNNNNNNW